jgi:hypothetical protein
VRRRDNSFIFRMIKKERSEMVEASQSHNFSHLFHGVTSSCQKLNLISGDLTHGDHTDTFSSKHALPSSSFHFRSFVWTLIRKKREKEGNHREVKGHDDAAGSTSSRCRILPTFDTGKMVRVSGGAKFSFSERLPESINPLG